MDDEELRQRSLRRAHHVFSKVLDTYRVLCESPTDETVAGFNTAIADANTWCCDGPGFCMTKRMVAGRPDVGEWTPACVFDPADGVRLPTDDYVDKLTEASEGAVSRDSMYRMMLESAVSNGAYQALDAVMANVDELANFAKRYAVADLANVCAELYDEAASAGWQGPH